MSYFRQTLIILLLTFPMLLCKADATPCPAGAVHCAYSNDAVDPQHPRLGNYMRITMYHIPIKPKCYPYGYVLSVNNDTICHNFILKHQSDFLWTFDVCGDAKCHERVPVLDDKFNLVQTDYANWEATPTARSFTMAGHFPAVECPVNQP